MLALTNQVQPYAWGSHTVIPELLGEPSPSADPQAELWLGAHPRGPSLVGDRSLADVIAAEPGATLGGQVVAEFGGRLPFLLKVLAAEHPLSIQVHPSAEQARAGFAAEEARGVPRDAPYRNYADDWPKPELICALTEFDALCGCRDVAQARELFEELVAAGAAGLRPYVEALRDATDVGAVIGRLLRLSRADAGALVTEVAAASVAARPRPEFGWTTRLAAQYPADAGVVVALLLNYVRLAPGEALYLPAGNMHAYLRGASVELMASSDNVIRGGLTAKHVDVPELLQVLDASSWHAGTISGERHGAEWVYPTGARHFQLSRVELDGAQATVGGGVPQILLCTAGQVSLRAADGHMTLTRGCAAFVGAETPALDVEGRGRLFRACTPLT
ncbi:MAG: mannose-6-phosphate isomerase, class I [Streptosporangiales bacterium]|nr:mannose-6-phosphate isomerase, class I [Streptosporangiales bacterium]